MAEKCRNTLDIFRKKTLFIFLCSLFGTTDKRYTAEISHALGLVPKKYITKRYYQSMNKSTCYHGF